MEARVVGNMEAFVRAMRSQAKGILRTDDMTRVLYSTDASMYQMRPQGVFIPVDTADVGIAVREAARSGIPLLARGAASSLAGQTTTHGVVVDFTRHLNGILAIDAEAGRVRVEPGVVLDHLNAALKPHGWMVGPDPAPSSRATIGGMVGNNSTGTHSIIYGNMIDHVERLKGWFADGTPFDFGPTTWPALIEEARQPTRKGRFVKGLRSLLTRDEAIIRRDTPTHWRRNSGYRLERLIDTDTPNLAHLLCGAEGTLAVIKEIELRLVRRPACTGLGVIHYETRREALASVPSLLETAPSAIELFDGVAIGQTRRNPAFAKQLTFIEGEPGSVLFVEYFGDNQEAVQAQLDTLHRHCQRLKIGYHLLQATEPAQIANVWNVRKESLGLVMNERGAFKPQPFIEDAAVPAEHLADYVDALEAEILAQGLRVAMYAHASAGCLHIRPFIDMHAQDDLDKMHRIATHSMQLVRSYGGSISSEHGDGLVRSPFLPSFLGEDLYQTNVALKALFDPESRMNPGKIIDSADMRSSLRIDATSARTTVNTVFTYPHDGGFQGAVEMCNGNGACRKVETGGMCPSFMATREEADTTRGRANALRAALSGHLPPEALTGEAMKQVMDLCVSCKACKTECPSEVDMARIKAEWLHETHKVHGVPLRDRVFAGFPRVARALAGPLAPMVNGANVLLKPVLDRVLNLDADRTLPKLVRLPFHAWWKQAGDALQPEISTAPAVVLFVDTFHQTESPHVAQAAARFLTKVGFYVHVVHQRACCGRPQFSKGLLEDARKTAAASLAHFEPYLHRDVPIIGLEPSCLLTYVDEVPDLFPSDARAQSLKERAVLFDTFVAQAMASGKLSHVSFQAKGTPVIYHGHCHQKALVGTADTVSALSYAGYAVEALDTACCGMAGSFGYEREHARISRSMAERRLAPRIRAADDTTRIAAPGTSCRAQILDTTGRMAQHPAELLLAALA